MRAGTSGAILEALGPPPQGVSLSVEFLRELEGQFGTEMRLLLGSGVLRRPTDDPAITAGERFFDCPPDEVMELNRTVMNVWLRRVTQEGDYPSFTDSQRESDKLSLPHFREFQGIVDNTLDTPELVLGMDTSLMGGDMGKSDSVADYMRNLTGEEYADHDRLFLDVLKNDTAVRDLFPSFLQLEPDIREMIIAGLESGFHLAQFMQGENLAVNLVEFLKLPRKAQDFMLLHAFFDIGGANGDTVQLGSATITDATYIRFKNARDAIAAQDDYPHLSYEERAVQAYNMYLASQGEVLGIDASNPRGRALVRMCCMLRYSNPDQAAQLVRGFDEHTGPLTQKLLTEQLNETGFEEGGSIWVMYGPDLLRIMLGTLLKNGSVSFGEAMGAAMTALARLVVETRSQIDVTEDQSTVLVAGNVVRSIQADPRRFFTGRLKIDHIRPGEARASLEPSPAFDLTKLPQLDSIAALTQPLGETMYSSLGGGVDVWLAAVLAWMRGDTGATITSVRGSLTAPPTNAELIAPNVYRLSEDSELPGTRQFEDLVARLGLASYLIMQTSNNLEREFRAVAEHAGIKAAIGVDTGGNALLPSTLERPSPIRDHMSLRALNRIGLDSVTSGFFALGIDAPQDLGSRLLQAEAVALRLGPLAERILQLCAESGLPSIDRRRFSNTLPIFLNALSGLMGLEELPVPTENALLRKGAWSPYGAANKQMTSVVFMDSEQHRRVINMSA